MVGRMTRRRRLCPCEPKRGRIPPIDAPRRVVIANESSDASARLIKEGGNAPGNRISLGHELRRRLVSVIDSEGSMRSTMRVVLCPTPG